MGIDSVRDSRQRCSETVQLLQPAPFTEVLHPGVSLSSLDMIADSVTAGSRVTSSRRPEGGQRLSEDDDSRNMQAGRPATSFDVPKSADRGKIFEGANQRVLNGETAALSALCVELSVPLGHDGDLEGLVSPSPSGVSVGASEEHSVGGTQLQLQQERQDRVFSAVAAALQAPLSGSSMTRVDEAITPAGSTSARSDDQGLLDSGETLAVRCGEEADGNSAPAALPTNEQGAAALTAPATEQPVSWEGDMLRRARPLRRAAAAAASTRRLDEEEEALALGVPVGTRVVSRLPGVKYCHSRNAWIARWSEEGQEKWKTFSVKACKGFTEARIQAVQFRWAISTFA